MLLRWKDESNVFLKRRVDVKLFLIRTGESKGEWGRGVEGSRLEAWMKSHKSEIAIT